MTQPSREELLRVQRLIDTHISVPEYMAIDSLIEIAKRGAEARVTRDELAAAEAMLGRIVGQPR